MDDKAGEAHPVAGGEIRELPMERLQYPGGLFDERVVPRNGDTLAGLVPPIVASCGDDRWCVIDGCKRVALLRARGGASVVAVVLPGVSDERERGLLRMRLNRQRALTFREKVVFLRWLDQRRGDEPLERTAGEVGIAAGDCRLLEPLLWSPERLIDAVVDGRLHASCARELVGWEASDQEAYLVALTDLSPSRQTQRELAEWLEELGCAEGVSIEALIEEIVLPIASDARLNPPQRIARIHQEVYTRRFPRFTAARRRWESAARRLTAGSKAIRIIPASFFEKDHLELHLRIGSADEAQGLFRELAAMPRQLWDTLIHPRASGGGRG